MFLSCSRRLSASWLLLSVVCAAQKAEPTRAEIYHSLMVHKVLVPGRMLAHLSYVCPLEVEGGRYFVVDLQELVKGAREPRGVNRVGILDRTLKPVRVFEYIDKRPLFCKGNQLFLYGDLSVDNVGREGNELTFSNGGKDIKVSQVEANDVPAVVIGKGALQ